MRRFDPQMPINFAESGATLRCPSGAIAYPRLRYMGNKHKLLPWIWQTLVSLEFNSAVDLFSGSGSVSYLLKSMGKRVVANDFLQFAQQLAQATVANSGRTLAPQEVDGLCDPEGKRSTFIEQTFEGIFFTPQDLQFLDTVWSNLAGLTDPAARALAHASLTRACLKAQPRGVFTVKGRNYDDGRRDLRLTLQQHFRESAVVFNQLVFDNGHANQARQGDALSLEPGEADLVYMDPPYVPRADDNCYVKRYHFLEGLASCWQAAGTQILAASRVRKIPKRFTPFSYRSKATEAFDSMFRRFADSTLVLSYSSNGFPDLGALVSLMKRHKRNVSVVEREHRYHFGTHRGVSEGRSLVAEYLIVGTG